MYRYIKTSFDINQLSEDMHRKDAYLILDSYFDLNPNLDFIEIGSIKKNEENSDSHKCSYDIELKMNGQSLGYYPFLTYVNELEDWYCKEIEFGLDEDQIRHLRTLGRNSTQEEQNLYSHMLDKISKDLGFNIFDIRR